MNDTDTPQHASRRELSEGELTVMLVLERCGESDCKWLQTMTGYSRGSVLETVADFQREGLVASREVPRSVLWRLWPSRTPDPFTLYSLTEEGAQHPRLLETIREYERRKRCRTRRF